MTKAEEYKSNQTKISKKYIVECLGYGEIDIKLVDVHQKVSNKHKIES